MTTMISISVKPRSRGRARRAAARVRVAGRDGVAAARHRPIIIRHAVFPRRAPLAAAVLTGLSPCVVSFASSFASARHWSSPRPASPRRRGGGSASRLPLPVSPYAFDVRSGATLRSVARELAAAGVLPGELALVALARLRGVDRAIKAGNYEIATGVTLAQLLDRLTQGEATQKALTVVEGATFADLTRALAAEPGVVKTVLGLAAGGADAAHRRGRRERRRLVLPRDLFLRRRLDRRRAARARPPADARPARRGVERAGGRPAARRMPTKR